MLNNGPVTDILPLSFRLTPEPTTDTHYPPALQERYETMVDLIRQKRLPEALKEARKICRLAPEVPMSHANLASILDSQGEHGEEIEALFRRPLNSTKMISLRARA